MRKYTPFGIHEDLHKISLELLKMSGHEVTPIENTQDPKRYLSKTVIAMGNVDVELFREILPKVRTMVYVGDDMEIKDVIREYVAEKDIPMQMENVGISGSINVFYNNTKTIEVYSSPIFTELEMVNKYLAGTGPKISNLMRYISQVVTGRNTASFDYLEIGKLQDLYDKFINYHQTKILSDEKYDKDEILEIYNTYQPK